MRTYLHTQWDLIRTGLELWALGLVRAGRSIRMRHSWLGAICALALGVVSVAAPAQASAFSSRSAGVSYYGLTSKDGPLMIETSRDGRVITRAIGALTLSCTGGNAGPYSTDYIDTWTKLVVSMGGKFTQKFSDSSTPPSGRPIDVMGQLNGGFDKRRNVVTGTWQVHYVLHLEDGSTDDCDSGLVKFTARRMQP
ncbi:MAG TPA: hypothetical protein VF066_02645 [Thermoleophilaceae bacterium]